MNWYFTSSKMRPLPAICLFVFLCCENQERGTVTYELNSDDSLIYEISATDFRLVVYQQKIKSNQPSLIEILIYNRDKSKLLADAEVDLTVINKGRRKGIPEMKLTAPGVYEGRIELNFNGFSTLEFEVIAPGLKNRVLIDQEILDN